MTAILVFFNLNIIIARVCAQDDVCVDMCVTVQRRRSEDKSAELFCPLFPPLCGFQFTG